MYGLGNTGLARCSCQQPLGQVEMPRFDLKRDLTAGAVAFAVPLGYHYFAPKKWPRYGRLGNVAAVIGTYFLTVFIYNKVTT